MTEPCNEFYGTATIARLLGCTPHHIRNMAWSGTGALSEILTKVGGRRGVWKQDFERWRDARLMLGPVLADAAPAPAPTPMPVAKRPVGRPRKTPTPPANQRHIARKGSRRAA